MSINIGYNVFDSEEGIISGAWHNATTRVLGGFTFKSKLDAYTKKTEELVDKIENPNSIDMSDVNSRHLPSVDQFNGFCRAAKLCIDFLGKPNHKVEDCAKLLINLNNLTIFKKDITLSKSGSNKFMSRETMTKIGSIISSVVGGTTATLGIFDHLTKQTETMARPGQPVVSSRFLYAVVVPVAAVILAGGTALSELIGKGVWQAVNKRGWTSGDKVIQATKTLAALSDNLSNKLETAKRAKSNDPENASKIDKATGVVIRMVKNIMTTCYSGIITTLKEMA